LLEVSENPATNFKMNFCRSRKQLNELLNNEGNVWTCGNEYSNLPMSLLYEGVSKKRTTILMEFDRGIRRSIDRLAIQIFSPFDNRFKQYLR